MLTDIDKQQLDKKEISEEKLLRQLDSFRKGFPYLEIIKPASLEKGILAASASQKQGYIDAWHKYQQGNKRIVKFVPASGAASRMFKDLFEFQTADYNEPTTKFEKMFFKNLSQFAFFSDLDESCKKNEGKSIDKLLLDGDFKVVINNLLNANGLNYGALPKGLLKFHRYADSSRTPAEEHLVEGSLYAKSLGNNVNIHFTVSPEHRLLFEKLIQAKTSFLETELGVSYDVDFSVQKSSTDTIAADTKNEPFRDADGSLLFRPGGHGALIENLNDVDADIVFIKNIDNIVQDQFKAQEASSKELLAGVLVDAQIQMFQYLELLDSGKYTHDELLEILLFLQNTLCIKNPDTKLLEDAELVLYLKRKLDRPIRVCGMVKNLGEPGGGPFLTVNGDETVSLQILESSQIDMSDVQKAAMFSQGTHFNPVDLVCGVKDYRGRSFDLRGFVDENTGFISIKSKNGKELKALELPGLWNGAMSDWNTIFVEVSTDTFNPVKTVNDLLRSQHLEKV